jgi:hypothetical protein
MRGGYLAGLLFFRAFKMKTNLNLTGWNQLTISQKVERDLRVYKKAVNWIGNNMDIVWAIAGLACFVAAIMLLKAVMIPYQVTA